MPSCIEEPRQTVTVEPSPELVDIARKHVGGDASRDAVREKCLDYIDIEITLPD